MRPAYFMPVFIALMLTLGALTPVVGADAPGDTGKIITNIGWTPTALYLGFRVDDPLIVGNQTGWLGQPWLDDAVAVYVNLAPEQPQTITSTCLRIVVSAANGATVQRGKDGVWQDDPTWFDPENPKRTIRYAVRILGDAAINEQKKPAHGYVVEMALPWELMGVPPPFGQGRQKELPSLSLALANYTQGETQSVSCWPEQLSETDLLHPDTWGRAQFVQGVRPVESKESIANASILPGDPTVDGELAAHEWVTSGVVTFAKKWAPTAEISSIPVTLFTAWYQLHQEEADWVHHPLEPLGPWLGPDTPLYHLVQLYHVRQAGIDALAVALPADPQMREETRQQLLALRDAMTAYVESTGSSAVFDVPLVFPVIDFSAAGNLDLAGDDGLDAITALLDDFYTIMPPSYRLMIADAHAQWRYPIVLPKPAKTQDATLAARLGERIGARWGQPIGWILDSAWQAPAETPGILTICNLNPNAGLQVAAGPLSATLIAPGVSVLDRDLLPRRSGDLYRNGWLKIAIAKPNIVLIRSWNDLSWGTEITPTREDGYQYADITKVETAQMMQQDFGIRILNHTLPSTLRPDASYPIEVLLKNGSLQRMTGKDGYHASYSVTRGNDTVLTGQVEDELLLLAQTATRIRLTLPTSKDRHPLPAGEYQLHLIIKRNRLPFLYTALLYQTVTRLTIDFTIAKDAAPAQLVNAALPDFVVTDGNATGTVSVRNTGSAAWKKGKVSLRLRWVDAQGEPLPGEAAAVPVKGTVAPGSLAQVTLTAPPAPAQPGWYRLAVECLGTAQSPLVLRGSLVRVTDSDLRAEIEEIVCAKTVISRGLPIDIPILIRNCGGTKWQKTDTRVTYQWLTWQGQAIPGTSGKIALEDDVPAGEKTLMRLAVTPPPGAGAFRCAFGIESAGKNVRLQANMNRFLVPIASLVLNPSAFQTVDMRGSYTADAGAAYADTTAKRISFDASGNAFPLEEFLPNAGVSPAGYPAGDGMPKMPPFRFGAPQRDYAPVAMAKGQNINLPAPPASALYFVAASTGEDRQAVFTVRYQDGTKTRATLTIANWLQEADDTVMLSTRHIHTPNGDDWSKSGYLFVYRMELDPTRTPEAFILPNATTIAVFAVTLATADTYTWAPRTGEYRELIRRLPDLDTLREKYAPDSWWDTALTLLGEVYPAGRDFVWNDGENNQLRRCWDDDARANFDTVRKNLGMAVRESARAYSTGMIRTNARYLFIASPEKDVLYGLPAHPRAGDWPRRGPIAPLVPAFMQKNYYYQRYFTNQLVKRMEDQDIAGVLAEYAVSLHAAMATLPYGYVDTRMRDVASFQLLTVLHLRQMKATHPEVFDELCHSREGVSLFLLLHDRATFAIGKAREEKLVDAEFVDPIVAEVNTPENRAIIEELRRGFSAQ